MVDRVVNSNMEVPEGAAAHSHPHGDCVAKQRARSRFGLHVWGVRRGRGGGIVLRKVVI